MLAKGWTLVVVILICIFIARSDTKDYKEQMFMEGSDVTLWCGSVTKFKWDDLIYVVWNISTQSKKCYTGLFPKPEDTCKDGKKLHNSTDGVSLFISKISTQDEGFYTCDLSYKGETYNSLNISVRVIHLSTYLEPDNKTAVCTARYQKKAPTLYWKTASSVLSNFSTVKNLSLNTIENKVRLDDNINISELVCVATYPSVSIPLELNIQDFLASGERFCLRMKEDT